MTNSNHYLMQMLFETWPQLCLLDAIAFHISDNEAAEQLQKARLLLFNTIHEPSGLNIREGSYPVQEFMYWNILIANCGQYSDNRNNNHKFD